MDPAMWHQRNEFSNLAFYFPELYQVFGAFQRSGYHDTYLIDLQTNKVEHLMEMNGSIGQQRMFRFPEELRGEKVITGRYVYSSSDDNRVINPSLKDKYTIEKGFEGGKTVLSSCNSLTYINGSAVFLFDSSKFARTLGSLTSAVMRNGGEATNLPLLDSVLRWTESLTDWVKKPTLTIDLDWANQ
jgi:hypothetical protein